VSLDLSTEGFVGGGGSVDANPPVAAAISPTPNTAPGAVGGMPSLYVGARATPIVITITDLDGASDLALIAVTALFIGGTSEAVYRGSSFMTGYIAGSSQGSVTNGIELSILRDAYWPGQVGSGGNLAVGIQVDAADKGGNVISTAFYYEMPATVPVAAAPPPSEPALPTAVDIAAEALALIVWQFSSSQ
jgi:hypothetical protein